METVLVAEGKPGLRLLDSRFAGWVVANFGQGLPDDHKQSLARIAAAVSHAVFLKHTCLDLDKIDRLHEPVLASLVAGLNPAVVTALLAGTQHRIPPLICSGDGKRIWLQKYHYYETCCAERLLQLAGRSGNEVVLDEGLLHSNISDEQKAAVAMALARGLAVITGGPGTGKTFTVGQIITQLLQQNPSCRIALAAPTGKAGQRMAESIRKAVSSAPTYPLEAKTLHSLLGIGHGSPLPAFHRERPLVLDVLIVDEASMIDLPMMYRLLDALPEHARLILLGDKDQLASVEAGSVLAELCQGAALRPCVMNISFSYRFKDEPEIGAMARWLNSGDAGLQPSFAGTRVTVHAGSALSPWQPPWLDGVVSEYRKLQDLVRPGMPVATILARQKQFQLLCALRQGPYGVAGINTLIEQALGKRGGDWYAGRPLMILQNDRNRKLFNGDVGMVLPLAADGCTIAGNDGVLKACFLSGEVIDGVASFRAITRAQLPPHETCYALTVHKSQGSEYEQVVVVLPDHAAEVRNNPVLTRELAYTAVTRARSRVDIHAGAGVLEAMAASATVRMSGLAGLLGQAAVDSLTKG